MAVTVAVTVPVCKYAVLPGNIPQVLERTETLAQTAHLLWAFIE